MLKRREGFSSFHKLKSENAALWEELMLLRKDVVALRGENETLKEHLIPLVEQLHFFSSLIEWEQLPVEVYYRLRSASQTGDFLKMYESLPKQFSLDDLISTSEQYDVNVFIAYEHIKVLLQQGKLTEEAEVFIKQPIKQSIR